MNGPFLLQEKGCDACYGELPYPAGDASARDLYQGLHHQQAALDRCGNELWNEACRKGAIFWLLEPEWYL